MRVTKRQLRRIIREEVDQNKDGKNDFDDVKIARMKASGMSDKEIKDKHPELFESDTPHPRSYNAPQGSKRDKQLDATKADLASGDPEREARGWRRRERMERQAREKNESIRFLVRDILIEKILLEELSKSTEDKIRKIAKERGMTFGSMKAEFKKGLAAWGTSGSKTGVPQHAWAFARIKKANPSDDWSVVKKSKS